MRTNHWDGTLTVTTRTHTRSAARRHVRDYLLRQGILRLLAVKDSDVRRLTLEQCRDAVDKSLHAGGAFSATIPLVALYYGGFIDIDVANPTRRGQDLFVLSKGHAVAALASIYAELGYFDRSVLENSRSYTSILNGHPGPVLPGIHVATGPDGPGSGRRAGLRDCRPHVAALRRVLRSAVTAKCRKARSGKR